MKQNKRNVRKRKKSKGLREHRADKIRKVLQQAEFTMMMKRSGRENQVDTDTEKPNRVKKEDNHGKHF